MYKPLMQCVVVMFSVLLVSPVWGQTRPETASGWAWQRVLKQDRFQDAMQMPTAVFVDAEKGQYDVVDSGRNRLLSFNRQGELLHIFNAGKALKTPFDMVKTDAGGIWVVEKGRNSLSSIDLKARKVTPATLYFRGALVYPDRIESASTLLYVLDKATGSIISYSTDLVAKTRFSCSGCRGGFVDFKIHGTKIWALDQQEQTVYRFRLDGTREAVIPLGDRVNFPVSLDIGPSGYIYILDRHARDVAVYDKNGVFKYRFLGKGMSRGQLYYPVEIRFDPWGGLCVVDEGNARVDIFTR
ncbi:MAG TPA: hypothetical protein ENI88_08130 [Desulfobulbus sp.]|nr:hypothetical protein [Desulfobulbus sp.]